MPAILLESIHCAEASPYLCAVLLRSVPNHTCGPAAGLQLPSPAAIPQSLSLTRKATAESAAIAG